MGELRKSLREQLDPRIIWAFTCLLDAIFLVLWIVLQYAVKRAVTLFPVTGLDAWIFRIFQWFFAISTLAPIALFLYRDLRKMIKQIMREDTEDDN